MKFEPRQDQTFDNDVETHVEYYRRGGVTHFVGAKDVETGASLCRSTVATIGVRLWRQVNCIACLRKRKAVRDDAKRRGQVVK